jgi:hypothetical protein
MSGKMVAAYAQNLGITFLKPAIKSPERGGLVSSTTSEIQHVEREHHLFIPTILAQGNVPIADGGELEVWGRVANFCGHTFSCDQINFAPSVLSGGVTEIIPHRWISHSVLSGSRRGMGLLPRAIAPCPVKDSPTSA